MAGSLVIVACGMRASGDIHEQRRRRDDRVTDLKRRVMQLAWLDGEVVLLEEGLFLVVAREVKDARAVVKRLQERGALDRATLERLVKLEAPPIRADARLIAGAHRELRALAQKPALDLAHEHRRALARYGRIDAAWLRAKQERLDAIASRFDEASGAAPRASARRDGREAARPRDRWFEGVVELVRALRGPRDAAAVAEAGARVQARAEERRKEARARVASLVRAIETGAPPPDPELATLAERLDAARDLPGGRARRRRVLDVLRRAVAWPDAPPRLVEAVGGQGAHRDFARLVGEAGKAMAAGLPIVRDPSLRERALEAIAQLGLAFEIGEHGVPIPAERDPAETSKTVGAALELSASKLPLAKAVALAQIPMARSTRQQLARWVAEGLEIELVAETAARRLVDELAKVPDLRAARAYATWATRLAAHYRAQGTEFSLSPELFANLPRNEDLAVLAMCLMDQLDPRARRDEKAKAPSDPIAVLDATLALFQRLPAKAKNILSNLRGHGDGEGRRLFPELAAWLDDDALLDRCVHVARLAGEAPLSRAVREDFEHAARARRERAHLEALATRSKPQQDRLEMLLRAERTLEGSPRGRTRRRIGERIERLLPKAYRRELDATFREILLEGWGIDVPSLTPAWRDAVRFWLVVDDNRELLGRLLRAAADRGRKDPKRSFPRNARWLEAARARMNVDAWLAPRRRELQVGRSRFVLELEEDPLEVLRMGIPFATCLALETGCNAASTVINAVDANKRVLYVRNASGNVVARKLLAISKDWRLIGYNLYVSIAGPEGIAIRKAVLDTCRALADEVGTPLAPTGEPAQLHAGFWYDDGTMPFEEDAGVDAYCKHLNLPVPRERYDELSAEARGWQACETGDVESAIVLVSAWQRGPANRALGAWLVDRLGVRGAEKRAADDTSVFDALARSLAAAGEDGLVRALDAAVRVPEHVTHHRLSPVLARFPPSLKIAAGLVEMGLRATKRFPRTNDHGLAHLTMTELPPMLEDVAGALDVLDAIEPVWIHVTTQLRSCDECRSNAIARSLAVVEAVYDRAPDPDVVVAALMSRRRTKTARRAALRIAARHVVPNGERAMTRLALIRPELAASADGIAALLRQAEVDRVTDGLARRAPRPAEPPFEAMRDLLVRCEGAGALVGDFARVDDLDRWKPRAWELAWRRRRADDELHGALFERAARSPGKTTRARQLLALLGDVERIGALDQVQPGSGAADGDARGAARTPGDRSAGANGARGDDHGTRSPAASDAPDACRRMASSLAEQVRAERNGRVDPSTARELPHVDAGYAELARTTLLDEDAAEALRESAREIVLQCEPDGSVVDWHRLLGVSARAGDVETTRRVLEVRYERLRLTPRVVVDVWQLPECRGLLVRSIMKRRREDWAARIWAAEREATARGLSVEGLLEQVALALVADKRAEEAVAVETADQLRSIITAVVSEASPADAVATYDALPDALSVSTFLRALRRQPHDRAAAIREAGKKLDQSDPRGQAYAAWLEATRKPELPLRSAEESSIERT